MTKRRSMLQWKGILIFIVLIFASLLCIEARETPLAIEKRADIIKINTLRSFGDLERPEVVFFHDLHTENLKKSNKDCKTCHLNEKSSLDRLSFKFKRLKDTGKKEVMNIYHNECIGCHKTTAASGQKTGPVEVCGECHKNKNLVISSRTPMGFDKSLHYRHSQAQQNKCEQCHHEYDQKNKTLVYAKNKEGSCRYCHLQDKESLDIQKPISMELASHLSCIDCHRKTLKKKMDAGPVSCQGCHDLKQQQQIVKVDNVPRIKRGQPDNVLIRTGDKKGSVIGMMRVPFPHKAHEKYNDTCRVCHHGELKSCANCHTINGSKEGKYVKLETAMHQTGKQSSCQGCHGLKKQKNDCAGCHALMGKKRNHESSDCIRCHMVPLPEMTGVLSKSKEAKMARMMPEIWQKTFGISQKIKVPEKVIINNLADRYEPVEFPHKKVFNALVKRVNGSKLAQYFHYNNNTLCLGCHHNTPVAGKPPKCSSCHGKPFDEQNLLKPGILGSYHRQCLGCHQAMGIQKPKDCTGCHKNRK